MIIGCILFDFYNFGDKLNTMEKLFTIGDTVFVLDDSLEGKVVGFHATYIQIETNDGFVLEYFPNELIKKNIHEPEIKFNKSNIIGKCCLHNINSRCWFYILNHFRYFILPDNFIIFLYHTPISKTNIIYKYYSHNTSLFLGKLNNLLFLL